MSIKIFEFSEIFCEMVLTISEYSFILRVQLTKIRKIGVM